MKKILMTAISMIALFGCANKQRTAGQKPNILFIYTDDLGYGDVGCYGAIGVKTPNVDALAKGGMRFTDSHSSASTCTPSRYAILTGSYAFRNNAAILPGSAPLLIRPGTPTLPGMLEKEGYTTAVIGKWHLGLGNGSPQWNGELKPGPLEVGFDYSFIVPATLDRVPTVFVENHSVVHLDAADPLAISYQHKIGDLPTGLRDPQMLKMKADSQHSGTIVDSISRIGFMTGGRSAWWKDENIAGTLIGKVRDFIAKNHSHPFFLYFAVTDIHVPRAPNARFVGKSTMGPRGDAIAEMDWSTGQVMKILKKYGLTDNTLVIFSSDNGPVLDDGYADHAVQLVGKDRPWGPFSGGKYSALEAGTRMPTIVYWPGKVKPGVSNALFSQVDFYASMAALVGHELQPDEAPDSYDMLDVLLGKSKKGRDNMLEEAYTLALRSGDWKYIAPQTTPTPEWMKNKHIATGLAPYPQLYNLKTDTAEKKNVIKEYPRQAASMQKTLEKIRQERGSRPGYQGS
jgi:arylsulfatase A-like enzyme